MKEEKSASPLNDDNSPNLVHMVRMVCNKTKWIPVNNIEEIVRDVLENPDDWIIDDSTGKGFREAGIPVDFLVAITAHTMGTLLAEGKKAFSIGEIDNRIKKTLKQLVSRNRRSGIYSSLKSYGVDRILEELLNRKKYGKKTKREEKK